MKNNYKSLDSSSDNGFFDSISAMRDKCFGFIASSTSSKSVGLVTVGLVAIAATANAVAGVNANTEFQEIANWFTSLNLPADTIVDSTEVANSLNIDPPITPQPSESIIEILEKVELTEAQLDAQDYQLETSILNTVEHDPTPLAESMNAEIIAQNPSILIDSAKVSIDTVKDVTSQITSTGSELADINPTELFQNSFTDLVNRVKDVISGEHFEGHFLAPDQKDILAELDKTLEQCNMDGISSFSSSDFDKIIDQVSKMEFVLDDIGDQIADKLKNEAVSLADDIRSQRSMA
jgi:hypothetical protein